MIEGFKGMSAVHAGVVRYGLEALTAYWITSGLVKGLHKSCLVEPIRKPLALMALTFGIYEAVSGNTDVAVVGMLAAAALWNVAEYWTNDLLASKKDIENDGWDN